MSEEDELYERVIAVSEKIIVNAGTASNGDIFVFTMALIRAAGIAASHPAYSAKIPLHVSLEGFLHAMEVDEATIERVKKAMVQ